MDFGSGDLSDGGPCGLGFLEVAVVVQDLHEPLRDLLLGNYFIIVLVDYLEDLVGLLLIYIDGVVP